MTYPAPVKTPDPTTIEPHHLLSIGQLSALVHVPVDTLRMWERRYGRPTSIRLPSGHRRYVASDVRWLRQVAEAIARGKRPSRVLPLTEEELTQFLDQNAETSDERTVVRIDDYLGILRRLDAKELLARFQQEAREAGLRACMLDMRAPLIVRVGRGWAAGNLDIRHEHLLTEVAEDFLRGARVQISPPQDARVMVFAGLEEESHGLGVQMAATFAQLCGVRALPLGPRTPVVEIAKATEESRAFAVGLSISLATGGLATDRQVQELRDLLPMSIALVLGGAGARGVRRGKSGISRMLQLEELEAWLQTKDS